MIHSFAPVLPPSPKILILGSMPGVESLRVQQYYAHPRNLFWTIMGALLSFDANIAYKKRVAALKQSGVALWDVLKICEREGSLDANIKPSSEIANDIDKLLIKYPAITSVFLNGQKASTAFQRHIVARLTEKRLSVETITLPSSSPANARLSPDEKMTLWHQAIAPKLTPQSTSKSIGGRS